MRTSVAVRHKRGAWYWWVTLLSVGLFAAVPMWHAWSRLRTRRQLQVALAISALDVATFAASGSSDGGATGALYGALLMTLLISSVVAVIVVRPLAYPQAADPPAVPAGSWATAPSAPSAAGWEMAPADGALVSAALARRQLREKSRGIAAGDPVLARDLRIGRPDLHPSYDDGGLVDVNSAPAEVLAQVLEIGPDLAQQVVAARTRFTGFHSVDELLTCVAFTEGQTALIRDRAVTVPV